MAQSELLPEAQPSRLTFVSEGEANLHYIMRHRHELGLNGGDVGSVTALPPPAECSHFYQQKGDGVLVLDAGAGTIDIGSYNIIQWSPVIMEEMNIPESEYLVHKFVFSSKAKHSFGR